MRHFLLLSLALIASFLGLSCASSGGDGFMAPGTSLPKNLTFDVTVHIDRAQDKEVAWQVGTYAALLAEKNRGDAGFDKKSPVFTAKIKVVQRSYVEHLAIRTSIFGELCILDNAGSDITDAPAVIFRHNYYYIGRDTISSAKMQKRMVKKLLRKVLKGKGGA
jgi:hypothetical protein